MGYRLILFISDLVYVRFEREMAGIVEVHFGRDKIRRVVPAGQDRWTPNSSQSALP
jgi:hypothetical protein